MNSLESDSLLTPQEKINLELTNRSFPFFATSGGQSNRNNDSGLWVCPHSNYRTEFSRPDSQPPHQEVLPTESKSKHVLSTESKSKQDCVIYRK